MDRKDFDYSAEGGRAPTPGNDAPGAHPIAEVTPADIPTLYAVSSPARPKSEDEPPCVRKVVWREKGRRHGLALYYDSGGRLTKLRCYNHGKLHGPQILMENGFIKLFNIFVHGAHYPFWMDWDPRTGEPDTAPQRAFHECSPPLLEGTGRSSDITLVMTHRPDPATIGGPRWLRIHRMPHGDVDYIPGYDPSCVQGRREWEPYGEQQYVEALIQHHLAHENLRLEEVRPVATISPDVLRDLARRRKGEFPPEDAIHLTEYQVWTTRERREGYHDTLTERYPHRCVGVGIRDWNTNFGGIPFGEVARRNVPGIRVVSPRDKRIYLVPYTMPLGRGAMLWSNVMNQFGLPGWEEAMVHRASDPRNPFPADPQKEGDRLRIHNDGHTKTFIVTYPNAPEEHPCPTEEAMEE